MIDGLLEAKRIIMEFSVSAQDAAEQDEDDSDFEIGRLNGIYDCETLIDEAIKNARGTSST